MMSYKDVPRDVIEGLIRELVGTFVRERAQDLRAGWYNPVKSSNFAVLACGATA